MKTGLTFGIGHLLGSNPLTDELYKSASKAVPVISNVVVYILDYLDMLFGKRSERRNNARFR